MKFASNVLAIASFFSFCAALVIYVLYPSQEMVLAAWGVALALFLGWMFLNRKWLLHFFTKKTTRHGANVAFVVLLVLAILVFVNILAKEYNWKKDITQSASNSLSPQTEKILRDLNQEVKVYYFSGLGEKEKNEALFKNYEYESKHLKYEFVDIARRPTFTQAMEVKRPDTVVLVLGDSNKKVKIEGVTEEKITNGLIKLLRSKDQVVYFTLGHGERELAPETSPLGYALLKGELEKQGYTVKELNLFSEGKIPEDAGVLVIGGPKTAFFPKELEILEAWLKAGGKAALALDLEPADNGLSKGSRQLAELLGQWGIVVHNQMLVDPTSRAANVEPQVLLGFSGSKQHPITKDFAFSAMAANFLFPLTTYLTQKETEGLSVESLVKTSPNAWAESDWGSLKSGAVSFQSGQDAQGVMSLAMAVEVNSKSSGEQVADKKEKKAGTRLVVFATSTFAANSLLDKVGNRDLMLNSIAWLASDEQLISIRPKEDSDGLKSFDNSVLNLVLLITVFLIPLVLVIAGVAVWWRRSKL